MQPIQTEPIPHPPGLPIIGNMRDLDSAHPIESMMRLTKEYGPIIRITIPSLGSRIFVSGYSLVNEICDEKRFEKSLGPGIRILNSSPITAHGLFTSETEDPLWHRAHNILISEFSQQAMSRYFPMMVDIAEQLMLKWARLNPGETVDVTQDMTRLTLDTIALCGFDYRFNSFYRDTPHPYVAAMVRNLERGQAATRELPIEKQLHFKEHEARDADINLMVGIIDNIIAARRAEGGAKRHNDLLDSMLNGVDKETGLKLDDTNIRAQCNTFLVAGHETTSGLLSFAIYYLVKHPDVAARAREEVDRVLGDDLGVMPTYPQTHRLPYISQILNETLRLNPTAPIFSRQPREETVIGGKYHLDKGEGMSILLGAFHRDKSVWGDNAEEFDPDHFSPENEAKLPPNAFKPFGTGIRACIGRQFALQEATLVLAMLLQRFEFVDSENYQLQTKQALTIKPAEFHISVIPRPGRSPAAIPVATVAAAPQPAPQPSPQAAPAADGSGTPLLVLYGSNLGTAEHLAREIANDGAIQGFNVTVGTLDEYAGKLPKEGGVVVVSASYNGMPPDNAAKFCAWLEDPALSADALNGVEFAVFGCGNRDWGSTYQKVPTFIDAQLEAHGARRMYKRGEGDARGDFDGDYRSWYSPLWQSLAQEFNVPTTTSQPQKTSPRFQITFTNKRATSESVAAYEAYPMTVQINRELQTRDGERPSDRSTRHVRVTLPEGKTYHTGDHLGILPVNSFESIQRVLYHYNLDPGFYITIAKSARGTSYLPVDTPMPLLEVLASRVELQEVATRSQIQVLAEYTSDPQEKQALLAMAGDDDASKALYQQQVFAPNKSLLDLMDDHSSSNLPFDVFLALLPPLKPRYYSIASSPMVSPDKCDIAVGVVNSPARSGHGIFRGVSSTYLERMPNARPVIGFIRQPTIPFHPPENPHTPMIMVGAGTGVAPFRGFIQERAALKAKGAPIGESLLFFGCRDPLQDYIFQEELQEFEAQGIVRVHMGFSRVPGQPKVYVQDTIRAQADDVWRLLGDGAIVFVCGEANRMAPAVRAAFMDVFKQKTNASDADAQAWLAGLKESKRYLEDIWGGKGPG